MKKSERRILTEALLHLDQLSKYAERDLKDQAIRDAIALRLSSALDVLAGLPSKTLFNLFGDSWNAMKSTRNRIVHGYLSVDHEIIEAVVREDTPPLMRAGAQIRASRTSLHRANQFRGRFPYRT